METKISDLATLINSKIDTSNLDTFSYISTENMLPNFGGVIEATSVPTSRVSEFKEQDILISNIRPYFRKTWFAAFSGGCSNDVLVLRAKEKEINPKYLFYALSIDRFVNYYVASCKGTKMPRGNKEALLEWKISVPSMLMQQHIVNTIGSIDDLIENYGKQELKIKYIGIKKINLLNSANVLHPLTDVVSFEKGIETGSSNYIETPENKNGLIPYIRVGDLETSKECYVSDNPNLKKCNADDILIAFDGAPGRINLGLSGAYSSGIYKVISKEKGFVLFELLSDLNQAIIKDNSQGTTILHASKSIQHLKASKLTIQEANLFEVLYEELVTIKVKKKICLNIKETLLNKYFTN